MFPLTYSSLMSHSRLATSSSWAFDEGDTILQSLEMKIENVVNVMNLVVFLTNLVVNIMYQFALCGKYKSMPLQYPIISVLNVYCLNK